jgi:hypothetical protein
VVAPEGGLLQLVEAERRLAQALAMVEQEAAALVGAAREEAAVESARLEQRIAAEIAGLTARIAADRDTEIARITADAERYCRAAGALSDEAVDALAAEVEAQLLTLSPAEPGR